MTAHGFGKDYWEQHWTPAEGTARHRAVPVNPHVISETRDLTPGTALDAGCGTGAEAIWLARNNWQVTGADISRMALSVAVEQSEEASVENRMTWVETDLTTWEPHERWDLVVTNYAHPAIPQLDFYQRISGWVARGGTLLIVGHLHEPGAAPSHHPREASVTSDEITGLFTSPAWEIETARQNTRLIARPGGGAVSLSDVIVRARRNL